jgi:enolase
MKEFLEEERNKWQNNMEKQMREKSELEKLATEQREVEQKKEVKQAIEHARREWEDSHEYHVEQIKNSMEEQIQERISAEVNNWFFLYTNSCHGDL